MRCVFLLCLARFLYISKENKKKMKNYIYLMLSNSTADGRFTISAYNTLEDAQKKLDTYIEAQKEIEGISDDNIYIDRHSHERLTLPGFIVRDSDILVHVTVNTKAHYDGKDRIVKTDRYIVRVEIN